MNSIKKCKTWITQFCWNVNSIEKWILLKKWIISKSEFFLKTQFCWKLNFVQNLIFLICEFCFKKWILLIKWIFSLQYLPGKSEAIFSRSSSTSGTDSSIRIRKAREGCTERRWFISVSLALIFTVLVASAGIYFGCKFKIFLYRKMFWNFFAQNRHYIWRENSNTWRNTEWNIFWWFSNI
mgnify:CR=1 FL=1